jgi:hypothetical protein
MDIAPTVLCLTKTWICSSGLPCASRSSGPPSSTEIAIIGTTIIIESNLLILSDETLGKEPEIMQVIGDVVDKHCKDFQIGIARVVDKMGDVATMERIDGVSSILLLASEEVEIEQIRLADCVVFSTSCLAFLKRDKLTDVLIDEGSRRNVL